MPHALDHARAWAKLFADLMTDKKCSYKEPYSYSYLNLHVGTKFSSTAVYIRLTRTILVDRTVVVMLKSQVLGCVTSCWENNRNKQSSELHVRS